MHRNLGVGSWIARRALRTPHRTALVFEGRAITYAALARDVTALAHLLERHGVGAGDRVAFVGTNHPLAVQTVFACGLLGAVFVPVHPGFSPAGMDAVFGQATPRVTIATADVEATLLRLPEPPPNLLTTAIVPRIGSRLHDLYADDADEPVDRAVDLDWTFILGFSSGTTGPSKGVCLSHRNVFSNAVNTADSMAIGRDDVLLTSAPLWRMGGLGLALTTLFQGGTCVLQARPDPEVSVRLIAEHQVTVLFDAPDSLRAFASAPSFCAAAVASVRSCVTGGSFVPPALVEEFRPHGIRVRGGYGLTEASPVCLVLDDEDLDAHPGAVGRPPILSSATVVSEHGDELPPGEIGELWVSGPNIMLGYWQDPAATARVLRDGWLRTGDAASVSPDGVFTVYGRLADAVRVEGRRTHPAPLEAQLRGHHGVRECALVQSPGDGGLHLFAAAEPGHVLDLAGLDRSLRAHLGAVEVALHPVPALPRNPNGKILRAELRERATTERPAMPPRHRAAPQAVQW